MASYAPASAFGFGGLDTSYTNTVGQNAYSSVPYTSSLPTVYGDASSAFGAGYGGLSGSVVPASGSYQAYGSNAAALTGYTAGASHSGFSFPASLSFDGSFPTSYQVPTSGFGGYTGGFGGGTTTLAGSTAAFGGSTVLFGGTYGGTYGGFGVPTFGSSAVAPPSSRELGARGLSDLGLPKPKLIYFATRGLAEVIRLILIDSGLDYEEEKITTKEQWDKMKPTLKRGQVPVLEIGGERWYQSRAISERLARRFGYFGLNEKEAGNITEYIEDIVDLVRAAPTQAVLSQDPEARERVKAFREGIIKRFLPGFDYELGLNDARHLVGTTLSLADIYLFVFLDTWLPIEGMHGFLEPFKNIQKFVAHFRERPRIAAYLNSDRPYPNPVTPAQRAQVMEILGRK